MKSRTRKREIIILGTVVGLICCLAVLPAIISQVRSNDKWKDRSNVCVIDTPEHVLQGKIFYQYRQTLFLMTYVGTDKNTGEKCETTQRETERRYEKWKYGYTQ